MSGAATLTCTGAPQGATFSVLGSVTVSGTTASSVTVSVSTSSGTTASVDSRGYDSPQWLVGCRLARDVPRTDGLKRA